jgi:hypothetical protein
LKCALRTHAILMKKAFIPPRNHMHSRAHWGQAQWIEEARMDDIRSGTAHSAASRVEAQFFWQRIAQSLDRVFAQRSQRAVSARVARRSRHDIKRCRQLMSQGSNVAATAKSPRIEARRTEQTMQRQS